MTERQRRIRDCYWRLRLQRDGVTPVPELCLARSPEGVPCGCPKPSLHGLQYHRHSWDASYFFDWMRGA